MGGNTEKNLYILTGDSLIRFCFVKKYKNNILSHGYGKAYIFLMFIRVCATLPGEIFTFH